MDKKRFNLICIFITIFFTLSSTLFAVHELPTPLSLQSKLNLINGSFHYPIRPV